MIQRRVLAGIERQRLAKARFGETHSLLGLPQAAEGLGERGAALVLGPRRRCGDVLAGEQATLAVAVPPLLPREVGEVGEVGARGWGRSVPLPCGLLAWAVTPRGGSHLPCQDTSSGHLSVQQRESLHCGPHLEKFRM